MEIQNFITIIVFSDKLTETEYLDKVKEMKKWLTGIPAAKIKTEPMGIKQLAHKTKAGHTHGWYVTFIYESTTDLINTKLDLMLRKDNDVIKFITLVHEGEYTPDDNNYNIASINEQKKPIDVFNLIFNI